MYRAMFAAVLCVVLAWALCSGRSQTQETKPQVKDGDYHVKLTRMIHGKDGWLSQTREITLPFVPQVGLTIDVGLAKMVAWDSHKRRFIVHLHTVDALDTGCRQMAKAITFPGDTWKDLIFSPK